MDRLNLDELSSSVNPAVSITCNRCKHVRSRRGIALAAVVNGIRVFLCAACCRGLEREADRDYISAGWGGAA